MFKYFILLITLFYCIELINSTCNISNYIADSCENNIYIFSNETMTIENQFDLGSDKYVQFTGSNVTFINTNISMITNNQNENFRLKVNDVFFIETNFFSVKTNILFSGVQSLIVKTIDYQFLDSENGSIIEKMGHLQPDKYGCVINSTGLSSFKAMCSPGPLTKTISIFVSVKGYLPKDSFFYHYSKKLEIQEILGGTDAFPLSRIGVSFFDINTTSPSYTLIIDLLGSLPIYPDAKDFYKLITIEKLKSYAVINTKSDSSIFKIENEPVNTTTTTTTTSINSSATLSTNSFYLILILTTFLSL
ncbi:hypothetical protein DLAC_01604 [Tieghemostelium lacteum]|uniref:Uncharacterized protein n=1 Tax=Tieghemostelium lacteum TaxID=361077 RepID=A0A152A5U5_TIELA|nr:hypothetical protein DLAC_01604 [Tieghemostelium lacteum]|eukprot:KYR01606.1 hypothetical protein DLAC_01604 [Tieghemostelium lacteum]